VLIFKKNFRLSHLEERKEKICLNCKADIYGRYCHVCGQENIEPKETVWHLVDHFFQDITHFDGKFFSTVKSLLTKPGFLSKEYMLGKRASYLNPIRMYVFTSAIFFLILFSTKSGDNVMKLNETPENNETSKRQSVKDWQFQLEKLQAELNKTKKNKTDSADIAESAREVSEKIAAVKKIYGDTTTQKFSPKDIALLMLHVKMDSLRNSGMPAAAIDSLSKTFTKNDSAKNGNAFFGISKEKYPSLLAYDSLQDKLSPPQRDGWMERIFIRKIIGIRDEVNKDSRNYFKQFKEKFLHSFPKILFISLPFFALILRLLYVRRKQFYYTSHGIFSIHVYCASFILFLAIILINELADLVAWNWLQSVLYLISFALWVYIFIYLYKAMRKFYGQRRFKTIVKFIILNFFALVINTILLAIFVLISAISI
jgi:hypothetical protein